jgi:Cu+-exporting ATPase
MLAVIILLPTVMPLMRERAAGQLTDVGQGGRVRAEGQAEASDLTEEVSEMAKDPVCGMDVDPETAAGSSEYKGGTYYFCNLNCKKSFDEDPERYLVGE